MSISRTRELVSGSITGGGTWGADPVSWTYPTMRKRTSDVIGNRQGVNPFWSRTVQFQGSLLTWRGGLLDIVKVPSGMYEFIPEHPYWYLPELGPIVNRILASTGPLTPRVNLPLALLELKDIPRMLKHAGDLLHNLKSPSGLNAGKEVASATLAYQFGWGPLISDIGKLLDFADAARDRQRVLKNAHRQIGVRRKVNLGSTDKVLTDAFWLWSTYGVYLAPRCTRLMSRKAWATIRWRVRDPNQYGKEPSFVEGFRTALGGNLGQVPITVWKALPWSWLIDWFAGISDLMQAHYNMVYYEPFNLCLMQTFRHDMMFEGKFYGPEQYLEPGSCNATWKERSIVLLPHTEVTLKLPFMDGFKLSILGSLAALRVLR